MQLINGQLNLYNGLNLSGSTSFTGSVNITGSLTATSFTGSLLGTASFALNGSSNAIMYQTASAASVWTFNHFLATQYPVITVYDNSNSVIIPQSITTIDSSSLTITFSSARTGVAVASKGGYVGSAVGTATTANALSTARLINNTTFDGTQNITIQNIVSGSSQLTSSYDTRYALSSSVGNVSIVTFNSQTGSYTLVAGDTGKIIRINSSVSCSVTLPDNTSVPIVTGSFFTIEQVGTGSVTAVTGSGVTILPPARTTFGQYKVIQVYKVDTNIWNVLGGIV